MSIPVVAVYVPTYNRAETLRTSLDSILAQTRKDFSLTVVDDCSTDETPRVAAELKDPRLSYRRNEKNLGMAGNWNLCVELALKQKSPYILIAHDDDWYAPGFLARQAEFLEKNPRAGLVYPAFHHYNKDEKRFSIRRPYGEDGVLSAIEALDDLCFRGIYCVATPAVMARRQAYEKAGLFDASFKICPDLDLWWRMAEYFDIGHIAEPLHVHTVHKAQVSSSSAAAEDAASQGELKRVLDKAVDRIISSRADLDARKYQNGVARYCAGLALIAAKDAVLAGNYSLALKTCAGAEMLSGVRGIHFRAEALRRLANPAGRFLCLSIVKPLRFLRAGSQKPPAYRA